MENVIDLLNQRNYIEQITHPQELKEYLENNHNDDATIEDDTLEGSNIEEGNTIEGESGDGKKSDETDSKESESSDEGIIDENKNSNDDVAKDTDKKGKSNTLK